MITKILEQIYTWTFFFGAILGGGLWRTYCHQKARYLDIHDPLPGGAKHHVQRLSRVWIAGLVMVFSVGYVLNTAQKTHDQTLQLQADVNRCWGETYQNIKANVEVNAQNDQITRQQIQLQRDYNQAAYDWLKLLLAPPDPELAAKDPNGPERRAWGITVSIEYQEKVNQINKGMNDLINQRIALDKKREANKLPELTCGR